jgi:CDGSH-type Zn-finger protein
VTAEIKVRDNGPYRVSGDFTLVDARGEPIDTTQYEKNGSIVLCRCGQSGTKPFCDQSHARCGFTASSSGSVPEQA